MRTWCCFLFLLALGLMSDARAAPQVDGGEGFTCALGSSGRAFCWGTNTSSQTGSGLGMPVQASVSRPTEMAAGFVTVSSSAWQSCGLQADGSAWCWGDNYYGQLGNGNYKQQDLPVRVQTKERFKSISVGSAHVCAIDMSDEAWCWGLNKDLQLGQQANYPYLSNVPMHIWATPNLKLKSISAGGTHTCGIDMSGVAWCWGSDLGGRAGINLNWCGGSAYVPCNFYGPVQTEASIAGLRFVSISAGWENTCAIDTSGQVQCWGLINRGRTFVPVSTTPRADKPSVVLGIGTAVSVSVANHSACVTINTGEVDCWGANDFGQLGDGSVVSASANSVTPVRVLGAQDYSSVSVSGNHVCGRTTSGEVRCWGNHDMGQLGTNRPTVTKVNAPVTVTSLESTMVTTGASHTCSLDSAGVIACWGDNLYGQIGHGRSSTNVAGQSLVPTPVARFYALLPRIFGQSPPETLSNTMASDSPKLVPSAISFTDLAVGSSHVCALATTGLAYCWGADYYGQTGSGKSTPVNCRYGKESTIQCVPYPTIVSRAEGHVFVDLTAGGLHTCGRNASGIVYCWGSAIYGELGTTATSTCTFSPSCFDRVPTQAAVPFPYRSQMLDVSAGDGNTCAVNGNDVFCWGVLAGPLPTPMKFPSGANYIRVGAASLHMCVGFKNGALECLGDNSYGQLGDGTNNSAGSPILAAGGRAFAPFDASWSFMCGVDPYSSDVNCWGANYAGQLGDGTTFTSNMPVWTLMPAGFGAVAVGTGFDHACAVNGKGQVDCWGSNASSQVGDVMAIGNKSVSNPSAVAGGWSMP
jgi:alpha-tubulin suppressor-like RCC1 family protein